MINISTNNTINISNISTGQVFSNYKLLCEALGENPETNKFKKLFQLKNISRFIQYDIVGRSSFLINKIYSDPLPINLNYCNDIDFIISLMFNKRNVYFKQSELLKELEIINSDYVNIKIKELKQYKLSNELIEYIYSTTIDMMKNNIERALKHIRNTCKGYYDQKYSFETSEVEYKINFIDSYIKEVETIVNKIDISIEHNTTSEKLIGVYAIINKINNRIYIGSSVNINARIEQHKNDLNNNIHKNTQLQTDYNYYGHQNFKYTVLELMSYVPKLPYIELFYIDQYGGLQNNSTYNKSDPTKEYEVIKNRIKTM